MSNANVSTATIKSFAAGYNATNSVVDSATGAVAVAQAGVVEVASVTTSFFAGIKFALTERGYLSKETKEPVHADPDAAAKYAALKAARQAKLKEEIELFNRAQEAMG